MAELKGTKTEKNLLEAFAGESQARNRYTYFAGKARSEGQEKLADYFEALALNEKEHAKKWFKILCGGDIFTTKENLKLAIGGEHGEWTSMYPRMAAEAKAEGFNEIAEHFETVGTIEKRHETNLQAILDKFDDGADITESSDDSGSEMLVWICRHCGHVINGANPPQKCTICEQTDAFYQEKAVVY